MASHRHLADVRNRLLDAYRERAGTTRDLSGRTPLARAAQPSVTFDIHIERDGGATPVRMLGRLTCSASELVRSAAWVLMMRTGFHRERLVNKGLETLRLGV